MYNPNKRVTLCTFEAECKMLCFLENPTYKELKYELKYLYNHVIQSCYTVQIPE